MTITPEIRQMQRQRRESVARQMIEDVIKKMGVNWVMTEIAEIQNAGWHHGLFRKRSPMKITITKRKANRFGARKYATVKSKTKPSTAYNVVKVRIKGTRNYKYLCTCPDFVFRNHTCKHIADFKQAEHNGAIS